MSVNSQPNVSEIEMTPLRTGSQRGCLNAVLLLIAWFWIVAIIFGGTFAHLAISSFSLLFPSWYYIVLQFGMGVLMILPLMLLALLSSAHEYRTIFRTWVLASFFMILLAPIHFLPPSAALIQGLVRILLTSAFTFFILLITRSGRHKTDNINVKTQVSIPSWLIAILIATIFAYPWLAWGALGSPIDTFIQFIYGIVLGLAIIFTNRQYIETVLYNRPTVTKRDYLVGGFILGTTILMMSGGTAFPFGGMQLILLICMPTLGWTLVVLNKISNAYNGSQGTATYWFTLAILLGFSFSAPLIFIDPDELLLISSANAGDILQWALYSAGLSTAIGIVAGVILFLYIYSKQNLNQPNSKYKRTFGGITIVSLIIGIWIYFGTGQPGFHGEGMFVILNSQADTKGAKNIRDYSERKQYVYDTLTENAFQTQSDLRSLFDKFGIDYTPYYLVNAIQVQGGPLLRFWLERRPEVDRIIDNPWLRPLHAPLPTSSGLAQAPVSTTWNINSIHADLVWEDLGISGTGIIIGQSDSGVDGEHQELFKGYRGADSSDDYNWFDPWNGTTEPTDFLGHGTQSLGIIVGQKTGVAPDASWYGCVNLGRNLGNPSVYLDCMQFMLAPFPIGGDPFVDGDPKQGAHISNNSWGCPMIEGCDWNSLLPAVRAMRDAGIFVVASAGNDGPGCESLSVPIPLYEETFAVGSLNQQGQLSLFSSIGPVTVDGSGRTKPDIIAPGEEILSAMPNNSYGVGSGTSFAGPHVAGVVALMWSANPRLIGDIDQTTEILTHSAQPYSGETPACEGADSYPSTAVGYGVLDAYTAVKMALSLDD